MQRNLDHRVEVAFPLVDPVLEAQVVEMLEIQLHDTVKGRALGPHGEVLRRGLQEGPPLRSQLRLYELGLAASGVGAETRRLD
jgi:polyphosphate kinase